MMGRVWEYIREVVLDLPERVDPTAFWAKVILQGVLVLWGAYFITLKIEPQFHTHLVGSPGYSEIGESWMHYLNLVFHEAGHIVFMPFGRIMSILGGSLLQVLMPVICCATLFFRQRDPFGASVALWWVGQSMLDVAPYVFDANRRVLTLLGGGNGRELMGPDGRTPHDWYNLLSHWGVLENAQGIARGVWWVGVMLMVVSMAAGVWLLVRQKPYVRELRG